MTSRNDELLQARTFDTARPGPYAGKGPKNYQRSDKRILEDVCEALTHDPEIDASDVEVDVDNGIVALRGRVASRHMKRKALHDADQVRGVRDVNNELAIVSETDQHLQTTIATAVY